MASSISSRQRVKDIFSLKNTNKPATWIGHPDPKTFDIYLKKLSLKSNHQLYDHFNDDCRWICAEWDCYKHPTGKPHWDFHGGKEKTHLSQEGVFAKFETVKDVENFDWPDVKYCDFTHVIEEMNKYHDRAVFSGMWACFFQVLCEFFGMETYFIKMYTHPEVVEAATDRMVDFYLQANEKFLKEAGDSFDVCFFGNDFGSQLDLLVSLETFEKFILPGFRKLIDQAHSYGKKALLHSCGAIDKCIPLLIDAGIDGLHPLQAKAKNMEAEKIGPKYKDKIAFVGGLDTQDLLVNATPQQVRDDVLRLIDLLGPNLIVSPSHEAVLPNVPLENIEMMIKTVQES